MAEIPKQELLAKLLKLTASDNDSEALAAIRKANQLLASAGWTWDKLLAGKITVIADPFQNLAPAMATDKYPTAPTMPQRPAPAGPHLNWAIPPAQVLPMAAPPPYKPRPKAAKPKLSAQDYSNLLDNLF